VTTEEQFLQFADLRPDALLLVTGGGVVLAANRGVESQVGLPPADLRGRPLADFVTDPADSLAAYLRACTRSRDLVLGSLTVRGQGEKPELPCRSEGCVFRPPAAGAEAIVLLCLVPCEAAAARFAALTQQIDSLSREIVRRKQVEEELRGQREWLRVTLASIGDAVIATDTGGQVVFLNPAAEALTGWAQADALHRPLAEVFRVINESTREAVASPVARVLKEGVTVGLANHTLLLGRDGAERPVDDCAAPIRDEGGRVVGAVLVFHAVGERRRLERELRRHADELLESDRRKDNFLSMLAHELRGPLSPVLHSVHLLQQRGGDAATREQAVETLGRQCRHLTRLVDGLLEATRLVGGRVKLRRERLDLGRLVRTTAADFRPLLDQAGLTFAVQTPPTPVWVLGDETRLAQVLSNLLDNAVKFSDRGGQVVLRLTVDGGQRQAVVSVRDQGLGIDPKVLTELFQVFAQADRSLDRSRGGLGLGLFVVKGLVELHGGQVRAYSDGSGRGTEVTVRLPLEGEPAALADSPPSLAGPRRRRRVLVIEDHKDSADSLRLLLQMLGHEVRVAYTGTDGVQTAAAWLPEVVISDIGLPGLDGYGVAAALRANPATARVLLVGVSGYGRDEDRQRAHDAGFDHYLVKPASPEELQQLLAGSA
jgi:PAS domain S-box-containing protein